MFAFELWGRFGAFRDPITVTQNVTLSIPPKTTIGGMLAAILGIDYNDYFNDPEYFDFKYSLVLNSSIRKQSFSQNYVSMYTPRSASKLKGIRAIINDNTLHKKEELSLENFRFTIKKDPKYKTPTKPIRRELLINPSYLIFIKDFKYEKKAVSMLKAHKSSFALYMGNSEFPANYEFVECEKSIGKGLSQIKSFTQSDKKINFESVKKYTTIYAATKAMNNRQYRDFKRITISDNGISFHEPVDGYFIQTSIGDYSCEFI